MSTITTTDRIEKQILLKAPRARVWRALTDSKEFGAWFNASLSQPFTPGARVAGSVDCGHGTGPIDVEFLIERMEPQSRFSYRWHPGAVDPAVDYSAEPTTLVEFLLKEVEGGTELTVVESGFDRLPIARRADALKGNEGGWIKQLANIERYLAAGSGR